MKELLDILASDNSLQASKQAREELKEDIAALKRRYAQRVRELVGEATSNEDIRQILEDNNQEYKPSESEYYRELVVCEAYAIARLGDL